jgi:putative ABC transport system ATP-binding protein
MLKTSALEFQYSPDKILHFPDIQLNTGEEKLIIGKSGCGKTTLLHLLSGLLSPTKGEVIIGGQKFSHLKEQERDAFRGKNMGIVFQQAHLAKHLTVFQNIQLAQYLADVPQEKEAIFALLRQLQIAEKAPFFPEELSVGEQQRVGIARALIHSPQILLADEPTSGLDDESCEAVIHLLRQMKAKIKLSLIIVTHDQRLKQLFSDLLTLS